MRKTKSRRRKLVFPLILTLLLSFEGSSVFAARAEQGTLTDLATQFVSDMAAGKADAVASFDQTMKAQVDATKLNQIWSSIITQVGKFIALEGTRTEKAGSLDIVYVTGNFEKSVVDIKVVFNDKKQITGLYFVPSAKTKEDLQKSGDETTTYTEKTVTVGSGQWALPGTLTMPKGKGPFPVLVLVHGSGPNDRDETIGPNRPFRDIAIAMAAKGIATLRYDKRTKIYGARIASIVKFTANEETVDDAVIAVKQMATTPGIDKARIYVLGHSLGGNQIPRIAIKAKSATGFIVLAGNVRPLEDLVLEQTEYILSLDKNLDVKTAKAKIKEINSQVLNIKKLKAGSTLAPSALLGIPAFYWLDLKGYNPATLARNVKQPMLILQGERDYQVTMTDFALWKKYLTGKKNVTFKSYKDLTHLFMTGTGKGKSTPAEYQVPGHVSDVALDDIGNWILKK